VRLSKGKGYPSNYDPVGLKGPRDAPARVLYRQLVVEVISKHGYRTDVSVHGFAYPNYWFQEVCLSHCERVDHPAARFTIIGAMFSLLFPKHALTSEHIGEMIKLCVELHDVIGWDVFKLILTELIVNPFVGFVDNIMADVYDMRLQFDCERTGSYHDPVTSISSFFLFELGRNVPRGGQYLCDTLGEAGYWIYRLRTNDKPRVDDRVDVFSRPIKDTPRYNWTRFDSVKNAFYFVPYFDVYWKCDAQPKYPTTGAWWMYVANYPDGMPFCHQFVEIEKQIDLGVYSDQLAPKCYDGCHLQFLHSIPPDYNTYADAMFLTCLANLDHPFDYRTFLTMVYRAIDLRNCSRVSEYFETYCVLRAYGSHHKRFVVSELELKYVVGCGYPPYSDLGDLPKTGVSKRAYVETALMFPEHYYEDGRWVLYPRRGSLPLTGLSFHAWVGVEGESLGKALLALAGQVGVWRGENRCLMWNDRYDAQSYNPEDEVWDFSAKFGGAFVAILLIGLKLFFPSLVDVERLCQMAGLNGCFDEISLSVDYRRCHIVGEYFLAKSEPCCCAISGRPHAATLDCEPIAFYDWVHRIMTDSTSTELVEIRRAYKRGVFGSVLHKWVQNN